MSLSDQNQARIDALLALTDHDWDMLRAHRPELLERLRRALRAEGRPSPEAVDRLWSIPRGHSYEEAVLSVYGHQPQGQFYEDLNAVLPHPSHGSTPSPERAEGATAAEGARDTASATNKHCFICAGADDDEGFDECAVCGRKAVPLPPGAPYGVAKQRPINEPERSESPLARAVRLARGDPADDVEGVLRRFGDAKAKAALSHTPAPAAEPVAYRWRRLGWGPDVWEVRAQPLDLSLYDDIAEQQPLYATPPEPVAISRGKGIYVASRASLGERGAMWRALRAAGHPIVSTWIDEDGPGETADFRDLWQRIEQEVTGAERLVAYLEPGDFPVRGVLIEIGMALAAGVPVFIVAPGVDLHGRSFRPLGSWIRHPLVSFCETVEDAILAKMKPNLKEEGGRTSQPCAERGPNPVLTDTQHSDGEGA